ncbi:MAG: DUF1236 domain-containing protein [Beijerinckiaceae bacterium]|nr:DUF1236 domain-containing protein [Beijerinckiaceae bacterium]
MKLRVLSAACAATFILGVAGASAQVTNQTTTTTTITTENQDRIRTYVTKQKPKTVTIKEEVRVGARLPKTVELQTFPADVGIKQYRYVYLDGRVALVDPTSYEVREIIEVR